MSSRGIPRAGAIGSFAAWKQTLTIEYKHEQKICALRAENIYSMHNLPEKFVRWRNRIFFYALWLFVP